MAQFGTVAKAGALLAKAKLAKDILDAMELPVRVKKKAKSAVNTGAATLSKATEALGGEHQQQREPVVSSSALIPYFVPPNTYSGSRGTEALRAYGFTVISEKGEQLGPTSNAFNSPFSRGEMIEMVVYLIKGAYSPGIVNITVWDAEMHLDVAKFRGLEEYGTASSGVGLGYMYRFAVFRGVGQMKWTGGVPRGGIPDVGCSGNINMGPDSIWFGNTDSVPHSIEYDLVKLMGN
eukprot:g11670.t1